jgi:KUP system potassium uptake protein
MYVPLYPLSRCFLDPGSNLGNIQTTSLGNAYGICVIMVTFITTCMVSIVALIIWRIPFFIVLFLFLVFGALDAVFLSAALIKVPDGAWFTILLALILSTTFIIWRFGKEQQWRAEGENRLSPSDMLLSSPSSHHNKPPNPETGSNASAASRSESGNMVLTQAFGGGTISTASGLGIFFDKDGSPSSIPTVFAQFVRKFKARSKVVIFFHMRPLSRPTVPVEERFVVSRTPVPSCYRVVLRHGYMDDVLTPDLGEVLVQQLVLHITRDYSSSSSSSSNSKKTAGGNNNNNNNNTPAVAKSVEHTPEVQAELETLSKAREDQMVYVIGKEVMKIKRERERKRVVVGGFFRLLVLETFLWIRENSRTKLADLDIDADSLVEVGFVKKI